MPNKKVSSVRGDQGAKDKVISVRVDNDVIENFDTICNSIGITRSQAINVFMRKVISEKGFPFRVVLNKE